MLQGPCPKLPKVEHLIRAANHLRQAKCPQDPHDLEFVLEDKHIPEDFSRADVCVHERRHLIFASSKQLSQLARAKQWYPDGTFKLCRHPFSQLFTINAFVCKEDQVKQVPLVFVLMYGRKKSDYKKILKKVLELIPTPNVQRITIDFEKGLWQAFRLVLPGIEVKECLFHWTQAVWKKVQQLGLQTAYSDNKAINSFIRKLMALPFLSHETITAMFEHLANLATTPTLQELVLYIQNTWIENEIWSPSTWSVFTFFVRTNNDVEGWHHGLRRRTNGRSGLPFYFPYNATKNWLFDLTKLNHERKKWLFDITKLNHEHKNGYFK